MNPEKKMIILAGPTAVGKTALSIELAKRVNGEILSADSMQVYRYMDIGSAKISKEEMQGVPHHLIDVLMPDEEFNVCRFREMAKKAAADIYARGHIPIVTGGTGFYIQALLYDIHFSEEEDRPAVRRKLEEEAKQMGTEYLYSRLCKVDPASAALIHPNNQKRLIRALEFYVLNGYPISEHNQNERQREAAYDACYFVLNDDREVLYRRIEERVDAMLAKGLVQEVQRLKDMGYHKEMVSMQGLGYKELLACLDGECTKQEAVSAIKRNTRHFAKRQLTWFRRERGCIWIDRSHYGRNEDLILAQVCSTLREKGIISADEGV